VGSKFRLKSDKRARKVAGKFIGNDVKDVDAYFAELGSAVAAA
jgi:hypothetical protein